MFAVLEKELETLRRCCEEQGCLLEREAPLAGHCSFRIGGPAQYLVHVKKEEQARAVLETAKKLGLPVRILGRGSNLLIADEGLRGLVLLLEGDGSSFRLEGTRVRAWAGESLAQLCCYAKEQGLGGLEFAYGIPGSVGGALYMNAGAYGGEVKDVLLEARYLDENLQPQVRPAEELELRYRHSAFIERDCLICEAVFQLNPREPREIQAQMEDILQRRREKQPLEFPSAGSTFKRPEGAFAAALIDQCGLKGARVGGVSISQKHAGFLVNDQGGSCKDVRQLMEQVRKQVLEQTGYNLEPEVQLWADRP